MRSFIRPLTVPQTILETIIVTSPAPVKLALCPGVTARAIASTCLGSVREALTRCRFLGTLTRAAAAGCAAPPIMPKT